MNLELINKRRNNEICSDGVNTFKIFNKDYVTRPVFLESFTTLEVEADGVNVPSIEEVTKIDGKWAFKSDIIKGKTLFDLIKENSKDVDKYLDKILHPYKHASGSGNPCHCSLPPDILSCPDKSSHSKMYSVIL